MGEWDEGQGEGDHIGGMFSDDLKVNQVFTKDKTKRNILAYSWFSCRRFHAHGQLSDQLGTYELLKRRMHAPGLGNAYNRFIIVHDQGFFKATIFYLHEHRDKR